MGGSGFKNKHFKWPLKAAVPGPFNKGVVPNCPTQCLGRERYSRGHGGVESCFF